MRNEVSTTRVSGWASDSTGELTAGPPAHAGGTDFTVPLIETLLRPLIVV